MSWWTMSSWELDCVTKQIHYCVHLADPLTHQTCKYSDPINLNLGGTLRISFNLLRAALLNLCINYCTLFSDQEKNQPPASKFMFCVCSIFS